MEERIYIEKQEQHEDESPEWIRIISKILEKTMEEKSLYMVKNHSIMVKDG